MHNVLLTNQPITFLNFLVRWQREKMLELQFHSVNDFFFHPVRTTSDRKNRIFLELEPVANPEFFEAGRVASPKGKKGGGGFLTNMRIPAI